MASKNVFTLLNEEETAVLSDLINEMEIRFCIFLNDATEIYDIKGNSIKLKSSTQLSTLFGLYNLDLIFPHRAFRTAIIFKGTDLSHLEWVTKFFGNVSSKLDL